MLVNLGKKIETVANLAIIAVACLLATVLVKNYLLTKQSYQVDDTQGQSQLVSGVSLSALDIDWKQSKQTLILAVSSKCHFCTESAPFYKRLTEMNGASRFVAVLPQSVQEAQGYLKRLGISVDEVRQLNLDKIGVQGTPTLLLVDNNGTVKDVWVGKLPSAQEAQVLKSLQGD